MTAVEQNSKITLKLLTISHLLFCSLIWPLKDKNRRAGKAGHLANHQLCSYYCARWPQPTTTYLPLTCQILLHIPFSSKNAVLWLAYLTSDFQIGHDATAVPVQTTLPPSFHFSPAKSNGSINSSWYNIFL